ncbi:hypothetical protein ACHAWF_012130 [Thalassiosira exigua]
MAAAARAPAAAAEASRPPLRPPHPPLPTDAALAFAFAAALAAAFLLGGAVGFAAGRGRRERASVRRKRPERGGGGGGGDRSDGDAGRARRRGRPPTAATVAPRRRRRRGGRREGDDDDDDGATEVLRGSLDLAASRFSGRGPREARAGAKVVEYLSPEEMSRTLFSGAGDDGGGADTLRLDERFCGGVGVGAARSGDGLSSSDDRDDADRGDDDEGSVSDHGRSNGDEIRRRDADSDRDAMHPRRFLALLSRIQKYSVDTSHPYFFNQLFGATDPVALAAEVVALSVNTSAYTYETAPVFTLIEREVVRWVGRLAFGGAVLNRSEEEGDEEGDENAEFDGEGLMLPGGSLANLTAMHAARHRWKALNGHAPSSADAVDAADEASARSLAREGGMEGAERFEEEKKLEDSWRGPSSSRDDAAPPPRGEPRERRLRDRDRTTRREASPDSMPDLVALVSDEAHYSFAKSARVLGLDEGNLIVVPTLRDGRMDVEALAKQLEELDLDGDFDAESSRMAGDGARMEDEGAGSGAGGSSGLGRRRRRRRRRVPFFVACTAGSTVRGSFDDVADVARICRDYEARGGRRIADGDDGDRPADRAADRVPSIWIHVDGAWGGSAIFSSSPSVRLAARIDDVRFADSFAFNPHKMLGAPQQTTVLVARRRRALRDASARGARYLFDPRKHGAAYDLGDLSYTCGRRTDAIKLWALWKYYGRAGLGRRVDGKVEELDEFVKELKRRRGRFALACAPWPFNVNFFYFPPRIRRTLEARGLLGDEGGDGYVRIPDDIAADVADVSVRLKLRLHEAGEMIVPYQPLNDQKADCFRLVLAGKKTFREEDIHHVLDTMERYGEDL